MHTKENHVRIIHDCINGNWYLFLKLIYEFADKNKLVICKGMHHINKDDQSYNELPLISLIKSKHCDEKWLKLVLIQHLDTVKKLASKDKSIKIANCVVQKDILSDAVTICREKGKANWINVIEQYTNEINVF